MTSVYDEWKTTEPCDTESAQPSQCLVLGCKSQAVPGDFLCADCIDTHGEAIDLAADGGGPSPEDVDWNADRSQAARATRSIDSDRWRVDW